MESTVFIRGHLQLKKIKTKDTQLQDCFPGSSPNGFQFVCLFVFKSHILNVIGWMGSARCLGKPLKDL